MSRLKKIATNLDKKFLNKDGKPNYEYMLEFIYDGAKIEDNDSQTYQGSPKTVDSPAELASLEAGFTATYDLNSGPFKDLADSEKQELVKALNENPHSKSQASKVIDDIADVESNSDQVHIEASLQGTIISIDAQINM